MHPEWFEWFFAGGTILTGIITCITAINRRVSPKILPERYHTLNTLLVDEEAIRYQIRMDNKINAIKLYRQQTNIGLKEAKEAVEMMQVEMQATKAFNLAEAYKNENDIEYILLAGNKINAIKIYRQRTGVGLKEAKEAVERMMKEGPDAADSATNAAPQQGLVDPDELQRLIRTGQKLQAIKYYRETTGMGLKEAKDAVDWLSTHIDGQ